MADDSINWSNLGGGSGTGGDGRKGPWTLISEAEGKDLATIAVAVVGSIIYAFGQGVNSMINAGFSLFVDPVMAMVNGVVGVMNDLYAGWRAMLRQGAETAVQALAPGSTWVIEPIAQAMAIASIAVSLYLIAQVLSSPFTSDTVFTSFVDNPIIGFLSETPEEEEDDD